ncbi:hypothetical protein GCM10027275_16390 [Rhabdobacter roseus]|uniref:Preprotein translocase subunit Sss1 n=1 Tax=Rhabdobacter roseus TaxID=1655419 RepID=A0A840TU89_9BACT|nr:hypothetical protein [Rhabdobacter roseus]MBB5283560.1 preprotein translocase subunit Sss1 [Rhabdobacter roseus]
MKHIGIGLLCGMIGFVAIALLAYFLIHKFSSNTHDRSVEAAMSSIFFYGPVGFIIAFIIGYLWSKNIL